MLEISQVLKRIENLWYIAEITTLALRAGIDDITSFDEGFNLQLCWSYTLRARSPPQHLSIGKVPDTSGFKTDRKPVVHSGYLKSLFGNFCSVTSTPHYAKH